MVALSLEEGTTNWQSREQTNLQHISPMQPTTNTPFERFAFAAVFFLMVLAISLPFLGIALAVMNVLLNAGININPAFLFGWLHTIEVAIAAIGIPVFCIFCAIKIERDHLKALAKAEAELSDIVVSDLKTLPQNWKAADTVFIAENVVIANDYLRAFRWMFRKLIGGESKSFSRMLARARREATLRVLRRAKQCGANVVWNIRYETSRVQTVFSKETTSMITGVEVLAYATAFNVTAE